MTDLSQFDFIDFYVSDYGIDYWPKYDYNKHNFILVSKHNDNSGAVAECSDCKSEAHVIKNKSGFLFDINDHTKIGNQLLSCKEIMIKNLLE